MPKEVVLGKSTYRSSQKHPKPVENPQDPAQVKPHADTTSGQQSPSLMQSSSQEQVEACPPQASSAMHRDCVSVRVSGTVFVSTFKIFFFLKKGDWFTSN